MIFPFKDSPMDEGECCCDGGTDSLLPSPIRSNRVGTWAYDTMTRRIIEEIFPRILSENELYLREHSKVAHSLEELRQGLRSGRNGYLHDISDDGLDCKDWNVVLQSLEHDFSQEEVHESDSGVGRHGSRNWLDAPWLIVETYFYRRVVQAFDFFKTGYDCFSFQKQQGLLRALPELETLAKTMNIEGSKISVEDKINSLTIAILSSLWGNRMDLSIWPVAHGHSSGASSSQRTNAITGSEDEVITKESMSSILSQTAHILVQSSEPFILDNNLSVVVEYLASCTIEGQKRCVEIWVDNAGYELATDLILAETLLATNTADIVLLRVKAHPTFVSDVTAQDVAHTIEMMNGSSSVSSIQELGRRLSLRLTSNQLIVKESFFLCQGLACWDMPADHVKYEGEDLETLCATEPKLIIVKGDANYRRLLGDRHWSWDACVSKVFSYWPVPILALRTFKAEIGIGVMVETRVTNVGTGDSTTTNENRHMEFSVNGMTLPSDWQVSGRYALIQFAS
jgi:hypothetical protein